MQLSWYLQCLNDIYALIIVRIFVVLSIPSLLFLVALYLVDKLIIQTYPFIIKNPEPKFANTEYINKSEASRIRKEASYLQFGYNNNNNNININNNNNNIVNSSGTHFRRRDSYAIHELT